MYWPRWIVIMSLGAACGPSVSVGDSSASGSSSTTAVSTTMVSATGASASGSTVADSTGPGPSTSTGPDVDTTTGELESVCDPQPQDVIGGIEVFSLAPDAPFRNFEVYVDCMIDDFSGEDDVYSLQLTCADGSHNVYFWSSIRPARPPSTSLELTVYWTNQTFGADDVLVVLRHEGEVQLAGGRAPLLAGELDVPSDFWAPLSVELLPDVCRIEPEEESETFGSCFLTQRQALRFTLDDDSADVYDHSMGDVGPLSLVVQYAEQRHDVACTDTSSRWYQWVATYPYLE